VGAEIGRDSLAAVLDGVVEEPNGFVVFPFEEGALGRGDGPAEALGFEGGTLSDE
jgi:hypothetical protein